MYVDKAAKFITTNGATHYDHYLQETTDVILKLYSIKSGVLNLLSPKTAVKLSYRLTGRELLQENNLSKLMTIC